MISMNDDAKKMANLLRSGNTMLNQACTICNNPLFRNNNGDIFCPICNRKVVFIESDSGQNLNKKEKIHIQGQKNDSMNLLNDIILEKIDWIAQKLKSETQIENIEKEIQLIKKLLNLLKALRKLNN